MATGPTHRLPSCLGVSYRNLHPWHGGSHHALKPEAPAPAAVLGLLVGSSRKGQAEGPSPSAIPSTGENLRGQREACRKPFTPAEPVKAPGPRILSGVQKEILGPGAGESEGSPIVHTGSSRRDCDLSPRESSTEADLAGQVSNYYPSVDAFGTVQWPSREEIQVLLVPAEQ
jgi:hypothetical protein